MRAWELFKQAMSGAARARLRSTLTALGVAIGCGALVSMIAFALGLQQQIEAPLKQLGMLNDIRVTAHRERPADPDQQSEEGEPRGETGAAGANASAQPGGAAPAVRLDDAALARIREIPGVLYAYPSMTYEDVEITRAGRRMEVVALALPREAALSDQFESMIAAGQFFSLDDSPEVLIAKAMLEELGFASAAAAVGESIEISTAGLVAAGEQDRFAFERKSIAVRIVGVFEPPNFGGLGPRSMGRAVLAPFDVLQQLPGRVDAQMRQVRRQGTAALDSYGSAVVRAENPAVVPRVAEAIRAQGLNARTMLSRLEDMRIAFLFIESILTAVGSVALVIAGLGIANTLLMTVLERYEEIGLYKAIGATDGDVRLMFLAEAAVLGLVGSAAGLALAAAICGGLQWGVNFYLARQGVERTVDVFYFPWWLLASAVAASTALSVVSGLYPASRAARVDPIRALRRT
ncbi:MAG TPA: ABC transporter permease [Lacipirellulaceae bacterium]|nr:ABC transporter permease [Lacipirellulaceae bacterium]